MKKILSLFVVFAVIMSCFVVTVHGAAPTVDKAQGAIDAAAGEFRITFDENVTDEILNTISFKKVSEGELVDIKGGAYVKADKTNPNVAVVKYGVLENECNYVLAVGENSYNYNVNKMEFVEDFENDSFVVGEQLPTRPSTFTSPVIYFPSTGTEPSGKATGVAETHYIGETADGDKYVALDPHIAGKGKNGRIVLEFPEPIEDSFCVDVKLRINGENKSRNVLLALLGSGNVVNTNKTLVAADAKAGVLVAPVKDLMGGSITVSNNKFSTVGDDGFFDLRMNIQRNADGSYKSILQNLNSAKEGELTVEGTATGLTGVYCIWLTQFYAAEPTTEGISMDLSYVKVYKNYNTDILHIGDVEKTDKEMSVVFTNDVDESSLSYMEMMDESDETVKLTFDRYDEANRKAYYKIGQVLDADTEYTLSFAGVKDKGGLELASEFATFKTMPDKCAVATPSITDGSGNPATEIGNAAKITYSNTLVAEAGKKFTLALAIFDRENRLVKLVSATDSVAEGQTSVTLTATTPEDIDLSDGHTIKPYVWEEDAVGGNAFVSVLEEIR